MVYVYKKVCIKFQAWGKVSKSSASARCWPAGRRNSLEKGEEEGALRLGGRGSTCPGFRPYPVWDRRGERALRGEPLRGEVGRHLRERGRVRLGQVHQVQQDGGDQGNVHVGVVRAVRFCWDAHRQTLGSGDETSGSSMRGMERASHPYAKARLRRFVLRRQRRSLSRRNEQGGFARWRG